MASYLTDLTDNQRELLIALPYRVGLFVSNADTEGGQEASEREHQALDNILSGMNAESFLSENIQLVINQTLARKNDWSQWQNDLEAVPGECERILDVLKSHLDQKDIEAFKTQMMSIAEAVALAFQERNADFGSPQGVVVFLGYGWEKIKNIFAASPVRPWDQYLRISPLEQKAIDQLAACLHTNNR